MSPSISNLETISSAAVAPQSRAPAELGKSDFLNLLIAQLQHQDPLKPLESTEFTAQLAQFTSLEQLTNINTNLKQLQQHQSSVQDHQAVAYIGKSVDVRGSALTVGPDVSRKIHFELAAPAETVLVNIYDTNGNYVRTIESGRKGAGDHTIDWDGKDQNGHVVSDGRYFFEAMAADGQGRPVDVVGYVSALVTGVSFEEPNTYILTEDAKYAVEDIRRVRQP